MTATRIGEPARSAAAVATFSFCSVSVAVCGAYGRKYDLNTSTSDAGSPSAWAETANTSSRAHASSRRRIDRSISPRIS